MFDEMVWVWRYFIMETGKEISKDDTNALRPYIEQDKDLQGVRCELLPEGAVLVDIARIRVVCPIDHTAGPDEPDQFLRFLISTANAPVQRMVCLYGEEYQYYPTPTS